jgi:hypothetical protein
MVPIKAKVFVTVKKCHEYSTEQVRYLKMFFVMHQHNLGRASLKQIKKIIDSVKKYKEVVKTSLVRKIWKKSICYLIYFL